MTEQEAIGYLKTLQNRIPLKFFTDDGAKVYDEFSQVVTSALEKQIAKEVYHFIDDNTLETSCCGIDVTNEDFKYCPECGQLLGGVEEIEDEEE